MALNKTPDMGDLSPAERAALYKQRAAAAGIGRAPNPGAAPAGDAPAATAPAAEAPAAPKPAPVAAAPASDATGPAPAAAPAPAVKKEPEPPPPPKDPPFLGRLQSIVPALTWELRHGYAEVRVPPERLLNVARELYGAGYDYLSLVTEVDWKDHLELLYHLFSYDSSVQPLGVVVRADLPREGQPAIASVTPVWPGAEYLERECSEMMGIRFLGHPDLRRILLPDDFVGFPMRKDYETDYEYVTVKRLVREFDADYQ